MHMYLCKEHTTEIPSEAGKIVNAATLRFLRGIIAVNAYNSSESVLESVNRHFGYCLNAYYRNLSCTNFIKLGNSLAIQATPQESKPLEMKQDGITYDTFTIGLSGGGDFEPCIDIFAINEEKIKGLLVVIDLPDMKKEISLKMEGEFLILKGRRELKARKIEPNNRTPLNDTYTYERNEIFDIERRYGEFEKKNCSSGWVRS